MTTAFEQDYFSLFGLPQDYCVDRDALSKRYRTLQKATHPDGYASDSAQARRLAVQIASRVNEAYRTLSDPFLRAAYWLELHGGRPSDDAQTIRDGAFLMTQMELRERIEDLQNSYVEQAADELVAYIASEIEGLEAQLSDSLRDGSDASIYANAYALIAKAQFFTKLRNDLDEIVFVQS